MLHTWQMITSFNSTQGKAVPRFHPSSSSEEKKDSLELILCLLNQASIFFFLLDPTKDLPLVAQRVKRLPTMLSSIPGLRRSLGEGNGTLLQYSCLENPMDRGAW